MDIWNKISEIQRINVCIRVLEKRKREFVTIRNRQYPATENKKEKIVLSDLKKRLAQLQNQ